MLAFSRADFTSLAVADIHDVFGFRFTVTAFDFHSKPKGRSVKTAHERRNNKEIEVSLSRLPFLADSIIAWVIVSFGVI